MNVNDFFLFLLQNEVKTTGNTNEYNKSGNTDSDFNPGSLGYGNFLLVWMALLFMKGMTIMSYCERNSKNLAIVAIVKLSNVLK